VLKKVFVSIIRGYQLLLSPLFPASCRFQPTCSEYSIEAIQTYGVFKGGFMAVQRISRCHPFGKSGYDPVIKNNKCDEKY